MFVKKTLIVFPWTFGYDKLSICPNVKRGSFRIGQLIFETKFQISGLIIAKQSHCDMYTISGIAKEFVTHTERLIENYKDGLICEHDFIRSVMDDAIQARGYMANSTCNLRLTHCDKTGCPAQKVKGDEKHEATEQKYQQFLDDYDANK
jgi:hypothetical protein